MGSSLLLGIDGLILDRVLIDDAGRRVVDCSTDPELCQPRSNIDPLAAIEN